MEVLQVCFCHSKYALTHEESHPQKCVEVLEHVVNQWMACVVLLLGVLAFLAGGVAIGTGLSTSLGIGFVLMGVLLCVIARYQYVHACMRAKIVGSLSTERLGTSV